MKAYIHTLILTAVAILYSLTGHAQNRIYPHRIFDVPSFEPDAHYAQPIGVYVPKRSSYSVLLKVRLPGDTVYYTLPGVLPTGDSFSFKIKAGKSRRSDTLYLIRRGGVLPVQLYEVCMYVISHKGRPVLSQSNADYSNTVLMSFYDQRTRQGAGHARDFLPPAATTRSRLPNVSVFSNLYFSQVGINRAREASEIK